MKVAYLGPVGTFSHQAARVAYKDIVGVSFHAFAELADIVRAVQDNLVDEGVLPFENSTNGHVIASLDLLMSSKNIHITNEVFLDVHQCLIGRPGEAVPRRVYSHSQAFGQCEVFLHSHVPLAERVNVTSTAQAVHLAARDAEGGAIAGASSIENCPGMSVLFSNIEDNQDNTTRFLILSKHSQRTISKLNYKCFFTFRTRSVPLVAVLAAFGQYQIHLTGICARPDPANEQKWTYQFFLEGHCNCESQALDASTMILQEIPLSDVRLLGVFGDSRANGSETSSVLH